MLYESKVLEKRFGTLFGKFIAPTNIDESIIKFINLIKKKTQWINLSFLHDGKASKKLPTAKSNS